MSENSKTQPSSKTVNIERLHALMDRDNLAAVVVRGGLNVAYLADIAYHGTLARHLDLGGSPRGIVVVWPRYAQPVIVIDVTAAGPTHRDCWIRQVEAYDGYGESLFDRVGSVLERLGLGKSRVGFDRNYIGAGYWTDLQQRLHNLEMLDATRTLDEVRWIKTPAEIERFRAGARLLDEVFASVLPTVRPGQSETQVHGKIIGGCLSAGAEFAHGILNSHRNPLIYCGESDFVFERGDIVRTDYLAYLRGYPGHQSRNAVIGKPSDQQRSDYARYYDIYEATAERLRPGAISGDIYQFVVDRFAKIGWTYTAGLVGHSVGPWWHQQNPVFSRGNDVPLQEGMVVALEPFLNHWHCQDLFRITGGAPELLSPDFDTSEMLVIE
jgi:Xaa-Pro aminopeptidase